MIINLKKISLFLSLSLLASSLTGCMSSQAVNSNEATYPKLEFATETVVTSPNEVTQPTEATFSVVEKVINVQSDNPYNLDNSETASTQSEEQKRQELYQKQWDEGYLVAIDNPDEIYKTAQVNLCEADRDEICRIVYGESGNQGYIGMCLIAQALKDAWCFDGCYSNFKELRRAYQYQGYSDVYSQEAVEAVNFIFDQNGSAVQHRILYMYAPAVCYSAWHESQNYVLDYLDVKFFDRWY